MNGSHNPKVTGSSPVPATFSSVAIRFPGGRFLFRLALNLRRPRQGSTKGSRHHRCRRLGLRPRSSPVPTACNTPNRELADRPPPQSEPGARRPASQPIRAGTKPPWAQEPTGLPTNPSRDQAPLGAGVDRPRIRSAVVISPADNTIEYLSLYPWCFLSRRGCSQPRNGNPMVARS